MMGCSCRGTWGVRPCGNVVGTMLVYCRTAHPQDTARNSIRIRKESNIAAQPKLPFFNRTLLFNADSVLDPPRNASLRDENRRHITARPVMACICHSHTGEG